MIISIYRAERKIPLIRRILDLERAIICSRLFLPTSFTDIIDKGDNKELDSASVPGLEPNIGCLEAIGPPCVLLVGPHRFNQVQFYTTVISTEAASEDTRYPWPASANPTTAAINPSIGCSSISHSSTSPKMANSKSSGDVLARNPTFNSLLSQRLHIGLPPVVRPRPLYFTLKDDESSLKIFPHIFQVVPLDPTAAQARTNTLQIRFQTALLGETEWLWMMIRRAPPSLYSLLQDLSGDFLAKVTSRITSKHDNGSATFNDGFSPNQIMTFPALPYRLEEDGNSTSIIPNVQLPSAMANELALPPFNSSGGSTGKGKKHQTNSKDNTGKKSKRNPPNSSINSNDMAEKKTLEADEVLKSPAVVSPSLIIAPIKKRKFNLTNNHSTLQLSSNNNVDHNVATVNQQSTADIKPPE